MSGEDKSQIYKTLNECVSILNGSYVEGDQTVVIVDRMRFNDLLKSITKSKQLLIRPENRGLSDD